MEAVFSLLTDDVAWANGMYRTHVHGKEAIREYWTHQWSVIDPHVEPQTIRKADDGSFVADVHQVVKNLEGQTLIDESVKLRSASRAVESSDSTSKAILN
jgi:ketosteroid isomerase-like protein